MKTVLITGASSGIGKAAAKFFASKDWNVVATMRNPEACTEFNQLSDVLVTRLDVTDHESIVTAIRAGIAEFGRIDVVVNNAGYGQYGIFEAISPQQVKAQFEVNVFGVMDVTREILPHFRNNKAGVIVNVSSGAGIFTLPMISLYCASKFALEGFSEALSYELTSQNIGMKLVIPHGGITRTKFSERAAHERDMQDVPEDYTAFVDATNQAFARMTAARTATSDEIAAVIYGAATDGTDRLRYFFGYDSRGFLRAKQDLSDDEYVAFMRKYCI